MKAIFTSIYHKNYWSGRQSRSGTGSDLEETLAIRRELPSLLADLDVSTLLDIPCGDYNWWKAMEIEIPNFLYLGYDIVDAIIDDNQVRYPQVHFAVADITTSVLPTTDVLFCRDCLGHLSSRSVEKAVANIITAHPKYLIATHWPDAPYKEIEDGGWRPINMNHYLPEERFEMIALIAEDTPGKYLGVWRVK